MSRRLLRLGVRVHPEKGRFRIHDLGADPTGMQAPSLPSGGLTGVGYDQMWIGSLQDDVDVTILLEEWDGEPPPGKGGWENDVVEELYLRGAVAVSATSAEPVLHGVRLMGGVGRYRARIRARHRSEIARLYDALLDRYPNASFSEEFQAALRELQGVEHYLVQLWPSAAAAGPAGKTGRPATAGHAPPATPAALPLPAPPSPPDFTGPLPALPAEIIPDPAPAGQPPAPTRPAEPARTAEPVQPSPDHPAPTAPGEADPGEPPQPGEPDRPPSPEPPAATDQDETDPDDTDPDETDPDETDPGETDPRDPRQPGEPAAELERRAAVGGSGDQGRAVDSATG